MSSATISICCKCSYLVTKHGYLVMTSKPSTPTGLFREAIRRIVFNHTSWLVRDFFIKNNKVIMSQQPHSLRLFHISKTEKAPVRLKLYHDCRDEDHIARRTEGHTKKRLSELLQELEIALTKVYYIRYKNNKHVSRKFKSHHFFNTELFV